MAEVLSSEAVLPCLLDRLTDDDPGSANEPHYRQSLTLGHFRRSVLRDLGWLLNAPQHPEADEINAYPAVAISVLNFGVPDLCGRTASSLNPAELEAQLVESIANYEPRILRKSLSVRVVPGVNMASPNIVGFEIRGLMWANPMPEHFVVQTELDLETGQCEL